MHRFEEIDTFLKYWAKIYEQNINIQITTDSFYSSLMNYDIPSDEKNETLKFCFNEWIEHFKNSKQMHVFYSEKQPRFLQFHSRNYKGKDKQVKLYLNCPKDCFKNVVIDIFSFMEKNKITSISGVADQVRADGIVIRVDTVLEAEKVMNYINNNPDLTSKLRKSNPFLNRNGVVGVTYDDNLSYNSIVSNILLDYFQYCSTNNLLNQVSIEHFKTYVQKCYNQNFRSIEGLLALKNMKVYQKCHYFGMSDEVIILNLEEVYKTMLINLDQSKNYKNNMDYIKICQNRAIQESMIEYYHDLLVNARKIKGCNVSETVDLDEIKHIIDDFICYICETQGFGIAKHLLKHYQQGEINYITRTNDFRKQFKTKVKPAYISLITGKNIDLYEQELYKNRKNKPKSENQNILEVNKKEIFDEYIQYNISKYGAERTTLMIKSYMKGNDLAITKDHNFHELFIQNIKADDIEILTNGDIHKYVMLYQQFISLYGFNNEKIIESNKK